MNDSSLVQVFGSFHDLLKIFLGLAFGNFLTLAQLHKQISTITVLCNDVHVISGLVNIVEPDNVVVADLFHDIDL